MRDVSRSRVTAKVEEVAHRYCHAHTRFFIAWAQFNLWVSLKRSVELNPPARPPVLPVWRKLLGLDITVPVGFCSPFCAVKFVTVFKAQWPDGSCSVSEGHDFL